MDKLQWFKFSPSSWMMGRIQRCSEIAQGRFIRLCCSYWNHGCEMLSEDAKLELELDVFKELVKNRVIYTDDEYIYIRFLDDQYSDIEKTSNKGKLYALKRWNPEEYNKVMGIEPVKEPNNHLMGTHKNPNAEEIREEEIREEEIREEEIREENKESADSVDQDQPPIIVDDVPKPVKKKKEPKEPSEVTIFREVFEPEYKRLKGLDFYWNVAEATSCKNLIKAMKFLWKKEGHEWDVDIGKQSLIKMMNVDDRFIQDNLSMKMLNSKFNDIVNILKNGKSQTESSTGIDKQKLAAAFERRINNQSEGLFS